MSSEVSPKLDNPLELGVVSDERTTKSRKLRGFSGVGDADILHRK